MTAWAITDVDVRALDGVVEAAADITIVRWWWGPAAIGHSTLRAEQFPLTPALAWRLFAECATPVVAARLAGGAAAALSDGMPAPCTEKVSIATAAAIDRAADLDELLVGPEAPDGHVVDVDVVICTRGRGADLAATLRSLDLQSAVPKSVVVVDNNDEPLASIADAAAAASLAASVVHEPRKGLSVARNTGIRAGSSSIVAFTDDDAEPHRDWLWQLERAFAEPTVASVSGLVLAGDVSTRAAAAFEGRGGLGGSFVPVRYDGAFVASALPYGMPTWRVGSGANMAVRRASLDMIGGFDERLGAGASGCSEDSELWYRLLVADQTCLNEPLAIVTHRHRSSIRELMAQIHAYQRGHVAALVAIEDRHGHVGNRRRATRQLPRHYVHQGLATLKHPSRAGLGMYAAEVTGYLRGLGFYAKSQWRADRTAPDVSTRDGR